MDNKRFFEWVPGVDFAGLELPQRQTKAAAGYDLFSIKEVVITPGNILLVPTGVRVKLPIGEFLAIYARSSLAIKRRLMLANGVGVIDADYYDNPDNGGEIMIPLFNMGAEEVLLPRGERIAQGIFTSYFTSTAEDSFLEKKRVGGFGSTGDM